METSWSLEKDTVAARAQDVGALVLSGVANGVRISDSTIVCFVSE